jgi:uncharacterized protein YbjT (DUF2867 family)
VLAINKALVTVFGGTGFLGRHTVRALAKCGYRIRVAVRYPNLGFFLPPMGHVGQIQLVKANVQDADSVAAAMRGAGAVVNLTGILFERGSQSFDSIHAEGAGAIAKAAAAADVITLVHVSAIGADPGAEAYYAQSKAEGEKRVRAAFPTATILRPSIVFGPEDGFFNKFADLARFVPVLPLIGGGHTKFQPVFVGDVAAAILKCVEDASTRGKTYELGGPTVYSFNDLMQIVLRETGRKRALVSLPFALASIQAMFLQFMPTPLLTPDQVRLLKVDNVVASGVPALSDLEIAPTSVEAEVGSYLWRFRARGEYEDLAAERITGAPEIR